MAPFWSKTKMFVWYYAPKHHELPGPKARKPDRAPALMRGQPRRRMSPPALEAIKQWWAWDDSNVRPHPYQGCALTT
ncbi:hypothetical protein CHELA40_12967 [Chelatococcus asaccharovorans]|nr:hypothetical protein CHELA40_10008 [Chelatococcus asaccharovorans]CAH1662998.1 hypothetical protein CHELA17_60006 [Chelatococcus asaccharovorans]CAH1667276.1 hypothetical protein CHELA40_12967 [Chelatococcus asaccharovorans]CAH1681045.1 hypothetical protein CHELA17_62651 [Chelatococcus asaccharovorans]